MNIDEYIDAIILNILNKKDTYGYIICNTIVEELNDIFDINNAKIYLILKRMQKENLITSYWVDSNMSVRRKKYSITNGGKIFLQNKKIEWINNKTILDKLLG